MSALSSNVTEGVTIDASGLPTVVFGKRSPIWWGALLLCIIEGVTLAAMFFTYVYLRGDSDHWPTNLHLPVAPLALCAGTLIVSLVPAWLVRRSAVAMDLRRARTWMLVMTALGVAAVPFRWWLIAALPYTWMDSAYASTVWTSIGLHTIEGIAGILECSLVTLLLFRGPVEKKHFEDVETCAMFWAFVVLVWLPFAAIFLHDGFVR